MPVSADGRSATFSCAVSWTSECSSLVTEGTCPPNADDCKNVSEALSNLPRTCVRRAVSLPVISSGPKPGIAFGSLKSHWFSAMPIKSRMAGSLVHAFRSAARVNSVGTRLCRNPRTSVLALIASIDGRPDRSKGSSAAASIRAVRLSLLEEPKLVLSAPSPNRSGPLQLSARYLTGASTVPSAR